MMRIFLVHTECDDYTPDDHLKIDYIQEVKDLDYHECITVNNALCGKIYLNERGLKTEIAKDIAHELGCSPKSVQVKFPPEPSALESKYDL